METTKVIFALVNSKNKVLMEFSDKTMLDEYIKRQIDIWGSVPPSKPAKISTVTTIEYLE